MNALFTTSTSVYNELDINTYDIDRNAKTCNDKTADIYHPPCRAWGTLKHLAKPRHGERKLAIWSLMRINKYGGVLEHPKNSELFKKYDFLMTSGIVIDIKQVWFGHRAEKATKLYIKGLSFEELPHYKIINTIPTHRVASFKYGAAYKYNNNVRNLKNLPTKEREQTPIEFAKWLIKICELIENKKAKNGGIIEQTGQLSLL